MPNDFDPFEGAWHPLFGRNLFLRPGGFGRGPGNDFLSSGDTRPSPDQGVGSGTVTVKPYQPNISITERGEVGAAGPANQANISPDTNGSRSYGILGLNSATGSAADFASSYPGLGLTAKPGSAEFNEQCLPIRLSPTATSGSVRPCSWTFTGVAIFGSHNRSQTSSDFFPTTGPAPPTWRMLAGATGLFAPLSGGGRAVPLRKSSWRLALPQVPP